MIHATALVETDHLGDSTNVWAYAHVMSGAVVGNNCNLGDHVFVEGGATIHDNVTIKNNVCIWDGVTIEDGVFVGPSVTFTNDRFPRSPRLPQAKSKYADESWLCRTVVRHGVSIGAAATICPGVELGQFSMIGAGAVVTKDVAPFSLVVGSPAKKIADVCVCGQTLDGPHESTTCPACGQTGAERIAFLSPSLTNQ